MEKTRFIHYLADKIPHFHTVITFSIWNEMLIEQLIHT